MNRGKCVLFNFYNIFHTLICIFSILLFQHFYTPSQFSWMIPSSEYTPKVAESAKIYCLCNQNNLLYQSIILLLWCYLIWYWHLQTCSHTSLHNNIFDIIQFTYLQPIFMFVFRGHGWVLLWLFWSVFALIFQPYPNDP